MDAIELRSRGSFNNIEKYLLKSRRGEIEHALRKYGEMGVNALSNATPRDSGLTAASWTYSIESSGNVYSIRWHNTNTIMGGTPVAILLQYGHGTGTGGYVQGQDYINPAVKPVFDQIAEEVWKVVKTS